VFSRIFNCNIDPAKVNEFRTTLNNQLLPRIQAQPGFVENVESLDAATGQFSCLTLWKTREDVDRFDKGLFQEAASKLTPMLKGEPTVLTLPVENSSVHHIKAGRAAA
jgi:hypothetical protein